MYRDQRFALIVWMKPVAESAPNCRCKARCRFGRSGRFVRQFVVDPLNRGAARPGLLGTPFGRASVVSKVLERQLDQQLELATKSQRDCRWIKRSPRGRLVRGFDFRDSRFAFDVRRLRVFRARLRLSLLIRQLPCAAGCAALAPFFPFRAPDSGFGILARPAGRPFAAPFFGFSSAPLASASFPIVRRPFLPERPSSVLFNNASNLRFASRAK